MAKSVNQVILLGRLTRDVEVRATTSGKKIANGSLAVDRGNEEADFFEFVAWEKTADLLEQYTQKGAKLLIQGRIRQESWDDKDSGAKRSKVVVVVQDMTFLDAKGETSTKDVVPTDIDDKPLDLSEIPF